jgi:hypothetical protein
MVNTTTGSSDGWAVALSAALSSKTKKCSPSSCQASIAASRRAGESSDIQATS